ncbi:MAG: tryptophan--tRNA ligase [Planctomycetota bacterium]|jgi:tryptophanyl-tRNA synthetase|nr:tryptophan--tRNA ligase [Planctomycetota bacterium]MDP6762183.1 tryptophan--tRNA ligase [Planctomycetota bacterium]MDP6990071.1 tryptophan--tRNA ligase [Planctomycetota bacterium]
MSTYLSGIQPSGMQHLGNYFGAIRGHIEAPASGGEHFYFIADYHALTTSRDPQALRERVRETAVTYLALGLDPERATLFRHSDVPEVCELAWLLSCVTGMGLLERAHSYKDKKAKGIQATVGLFTYPILMAADILAYESDFVPVGKDQKQHVEMAQDMAGYFNHAYGEVFRRPEPLLPDEGRFARVVGLDGEKMSKSNENGIWIFESGKPLAKRIGRIVTDSRSPAEPKDPDELLPLRFLELFLGPDELADWRERVREGGEGAPGYGHMKARIVEAVEETFAPARARREELLADPTEVDRILERGAEKARAIAVGVRDRALGACGLRNPIPR